MIKVLSLAFGLSIQDMGRRGYGSIGVPRSGAMDQYSAALANRLLNNDKEAAVLEITFGGCKLQFESDCSICITGADFSPNIDNTDVLLNTVLRVRKDSILSFGKRRHGVRTYLAVRNGFQTEKILGSRSFYKGLTAIGTINKGMVVPIIADSTISSKATAHVKINEDHFQSDVVQCYEGPEFYTLSEMQQAQLLSTTFTISNNNSRMGYQLEELLANNLPSMLTSAVLPGTVQLTPSGKLIVLMRDAQVTGGYPRVLQLTDIAINQLAQKTTGNTFKFVIL